MEDEKEDVCVCVPAGEEAGCSSCPPVVPTCVLIKGREG